MIRRCAPPIRAACPTRVVARSYTTRAERVLDAKVERAKGSIVRKPVENAELLKMRKAEMVREIAELTSG